MEVILDETSERRETLRLSFMPGFRLKLSEWFWNLNMFPSNGKSTFKQTLTGRISSSPATGGMIGTSSNCVNTCLNSFAPTDHSPECKGYTQGGVAGSPQTSSTPILNVKEFQIYT